MKLHAYLNFGGNCLEAFRFYEQHLGAKLLFSMTYGDSPEPQQVQPGRENDILYANLSIGETQLMGSDVSPERFQPIRSVYLSLRLDSIVEAERVYALLAEGGTTFMAMQETFFADRFAMLRDRFGVSWMILHERLQN